MKLSKVKKVCTDAGQLGVINVDGPSIPVYAAVEVLAHELAHIAAGAADGHGEQWMKAFDMIQQQYEIKSEEAVPEGYEIKPVGDSQPLARKLQ